MNGVVVPSVLSLYTKQYTYGTIITLIVMHSSPVKLERHYIMQFELRKEEMPPKHEIMSLYR